MDVIKILEKIENIKDFEDVKHILKLLYGKIEQRIRPIERKLGLEKQDPDLVRPEINEEEAKLFFSL